MKKKIFYNAISLKPENSNISYVLRHILQRAFLILEFIQKFDQWTFGPKYFGFKSFVIFCEEFWFEKCVLLFCWNSFYSDIDKNELILYEEVIRVPSFTRKTIIFLGPSGTARRKLISELIRMYPDRYGYPVPRKWRAGSSSHKFNSPGRSHSKP